jgi:hypothetical protein
MDRSKIRTFFWSQTNKDEQPEWLFSYCSDSKLNRRWSRQIPLYDGTLASSIQTSRNAYAKLKHTSDAKRAYICCCCWHFTRLEKLLPEQHQQQHFQHPQIATTTAIMSRRNGKFTYIVQLRLWLMGQLHFDSFNERKNKKNCIIIMCHLFKIVYFDITVKAA